MGLITYENIENNTPANSNQLNERFGAIVAEMNGGLDSQNMKPGGIGLESISADVYSRMYPIGSIYMNAQDATNPATLLGFGTWEVFGAGRVPVGKAESGTFDTIGKTVGNETESLTEAQMPAHAHAGSTSASGNHTHGVTVDIVGTSGSGSSRTTSSGSGQQLRWGFNGGIAAAGNHAHSFSTDTRGSGAAHNNIQPSVVVYMWRRVG